MQGAFEEDSENTSFVTQSEVMELLGLQGSEKKKATYSVKLAFPNATVSRLTIKGVVNKGFKGIKPKLKVSFKSTGDAKETFYKISSIDSLKKKVSVLENEIEVINAAIQEEVQLDKSSNYLLTLLQRQGIVMRQICDCHHHIERIYDLELSKLLADQHKGRLCSDERIMLESEIKTFDLLLSFNLDNPKQNLKDINFQEKLSQLPAGIKEKCPLIYDILEVLLLKRADGSLQEGTRVKDAAHALAILASLRSQKLSNDFKLMFTTLCVSYGAGERFIHMLNHVGLTTSWKCFLNFLDKRWKFKKQRISQEVQDLNTPLILLMDNVNMYRGKKRHIRLFNRAAPTMWNFTVRGKLIPDCSSVKEMMKDDDLCKQPQQDVLKMKGEDLFIEADKEKQLLWQKATDKYLLELLDNGLNKCPISKKPLFDMNETECQNWLRTSQFEIKERPKYLIQIPTKVTNDKLEARKSNVESLDLSLEDNNTITGTCAILAEFAREFNLHNSEKQEYVPLNELKMNFSVDKARSHFELLLSQNNHEKYMENLKSQLHSKEKELGSTSEQIDDQEELLTYENPEAFDPEYLMLLHSDKDIIVDKDFETEELNKCLPVTLAREQRNFESQDKAFWMIFNKTYSDLITALTTRKDEEYYKFLKSSHGQGLETMRDHLQRSFLHVAVEQQNIVYTKFLVEIGCSVNAKEGCGLTPLSLAVLNPFPHNVVVQQQIISLVSLRRRWQFRNYSW